MSANAPKLHRLCAAVFDFDGTLVDSNAIKRDAFFDAARSVFGTDCDSLVAEVLDAMPGADRTQIAQAVSERAEGYGSASSGFRAAAMATAYGAACLERIRNAPEIPGSRAVLDRLQGAGVALYVHSGTPHSALSEALAARGLLERLSGVAGHPYLKVDHLNHIAASLGCTSASIVAVGDGDDDRQAAVGAGTAFIGIVAPEGGAAGPIHPFTVRPDHCVQDLHQLPSVLSELYYGFATEPTDRAIS